MPRISDPVAPRIAILTVSDAAAAGTREDRSGPAVSRWAAARGARIVAREIVADDRLAIASRLLRWCDDDVADVVFTTGGTGLSPRDVTPEATRSVIEREAPGIAELLRMRAIERGVVRAPLSRGIAGVRAGTLIVNLPGSPSGVDEALGALGPILDHAVAVLRDRPTDHSPGGADAADSQRPTPDLR